MNFSKPMISRKMMANILCGNFEKRFLEWKEGFKKDLPALPPRKLSHARKTSLVQINSKLHERKPYDYRNPNLYKQREHSEQNVHNLFQMSFLHEQTSYALSHLIKGTKKRLMKTVTLINGQ